MINDGLRIPGSWLLNLENKVMYNYGLNQKFNVKFMHN